MIVYNTFDFAHWTKSVVLLKLLSSCSFPLVKSAFCLPNVPSRMQIVCCAKHFLLLTVITALLEEQQASISYGNLSVIMDYGHKNQSKALVLAKPEKGCALWRCDNPEHCRIIFMK